MICDFCVTMFSLVGFVCTFEMFVPRVFSLQSLTLGTRVLLCELFEQRGHMNSGPSVCIPVNISIQLQSAERVRGIRGMKTCNASTLSTFHGASIGRG